MRELKEIRNDLNQCDLQILELLMNRLSCIEEIIEYKKANGLPIFQPEQEEVQQETLIRAIGEHG
jgi:shikimate kinase